jgi:hypothetical protein
MHATEFETLKREDMFRELKNTFPELAKGKSRARKDELISLFCRGVGDQKDEPVEEGPPVRSHLGLRFVIYGGDPNRDLTDKETMYLSDLVQLTPLLGPKLESEPKGMPGRRTQDPHKVVRKRVRYALKELDWRKIRVLPTEEDHTTN